MPKEIFLEIIKKNISKRLDKVHLICYTYGTAKGCAQAFGTLNEFAVSDRLKGVGNRYGQSTSKCDAHNGTPMLNLIKNAGRLALNRVTSG